MYNDPVIIFDDDHILVVDKPAGLAVLPNGWQTDAPYLVKRLQEQHGRLWVVHRLDKITSGVMVLARTAEAHRHLNMQFERREAQKIYHAIICGAPDWREYTARPPLRADVGRSHRTVVDDRRGKPAATHFRVRARYAAHSLLEIEPETGRTHQIRAHAAALGFPILADTLYGAPSTDLIARPALHAHSLAFTHPTTGEWVAFTAPYPLDFSAALSALTL